VDLVSFLHPPDGRRQTRGRRTTLLIPFPVAETFFGEQLRTFDAVIFLDFAYQPYRSLDIERFLPNLREYARGGGAFANAWAAAMSFAPGALRRRTPIADILAVDPAVGWERPPSRSGPDSPPRVGATRSPPSPRRGSQRGRLDRPSSLPG